MATQAPPVQVDGPAMSFEEYLEAYDGVHAEWVDGRVYLVSPGNERQSDLSLWLAALIRYWGDRHRLGRTYIPNYSVKLNETKAREPDIFFVRTEHLDRVHGTFVQGAADLIVEVISPSTGAIDRGMKYYEYEEAGVPEYWLIDPLRERVEVYHLTVRGDYDRVSLGEPEVLRSNVLPGMKIPAAWLWQVPLPPLDEVFDAWRTLPRQEGQS